jgi:hypothetical protein
VGTYMYSIYNLEFLIIDEIEYTVHGFGLSMNSPRVGGVKII